MGDAMTPIRTVRPASASAALATLAAALALAACDKPAPTAALPPTAATAPAPAATAKAAAPEQAEAGIAWRQAANDAEVDAAFASARSENKPVFVY